MCCALNTLLLTLIANSDIQRTWQTVNVVYQILKDAGFRLRNINRNIESISLLPCSIHICSDFPLP